LEEKVRKRTAQLADAVAALEKSQEDLRDLSRKSIEAIEADRQAASRELHDSIGGSLSALSFLIEEAADRVDDPGFTADRLKKALSFLKVTIKETRMISANLRPLSIDDLGLLATIRGYVHQFQIQFGIKGTCQIGLAEKDVPETLKIVIFRLVQEALSNAGKHSQASNVWVKLARKNNSIVLKVQDDGQGFAPQNSESKDPLSGYGLKSMRERTEICKGRFSIYSKAGEGTLIKAIFSLDSGQSCGF
jgi:signal transduction histidine kinase